MTGFPHLLEGHARRAVHDEAARAGHVEDVALDAAQLAQVVPATWRRAC